MATQSKKAKSQYASLPTAITNEEPRLETRGPPDGGLDHPLTPSRANLRSNQVFGSTVEGSQAPQRSQEDFSALVGRLDLSTKEAALRRNPAMGTFSLLRSVAEGNSIAASVAHNSAATDALQPSITGHICLDTFHKFTELPEGIRVMVYDYMEANRSRVVKTSITGDGKAKPYKFKSGSGVPVLLHVSKEARAYGLQHLYEACFFGGRYSPRMVYLNPKRDRLVVQIPIVGCSQRRDVMSMLQLEPEQQTPLPTPAIRSWTPWGDEDIAILLLPFPIPEPGTRWLQELFVVVTKLEGVGLHEVVGEYPQLCGVTYDQTVDKKDLTQWDTMWAGVFSALQDFHSRRFEIGCLDF
ncbi:hypothetical protein BP6252_00844 [Coleophoma cylindrospora]|uniref:2EXR domain-containing protein n=1 Tax=Coleophoma cylindrospora TaxID=1849047 RepID=A0A3D8SR92_9HELO|nr:hypothetical protein BP6252_00844 [Coleophoma cylindrospora]